MPHFKFDQPIQRLESCSVGQYCLKLRSDIVYIYDDKEQTKLSCIINQSEPFTSNIYHSDCEHYHIVVPEEIVKSIGKQQGDLVSFVIYETRMRQAV